MYELHHNPFSQHGRRIVSLLEEVNLGYKIVLVDMMTGGHLSEEYLSLNPNHQVPTLVEGDFSLYESNAILRFLCERHKLEQWYPSDHKQRAQVNLWLDWNQCQLSGATVDIVLNSVFLGEQGDQQAIERGKARWQELSQILESHLSDKSYLVGNLATIADLSLASNIFQLSLAKVLPESPALASWYERISNLKGFKKSLPEM